MAYPVAENNAGLTIISFLILYFYAACVSESILLNRKWRLAKGQEQFRIRKYCTATNEYSITPEIQLHLLAPNIPYWPYYQDSSSEEGEPDLPFDGELYWAFYSPGGQGLSRYVLDHPEIVKDKRVLDVGSGSGAIAIAAAKAGAKTVTANDIDEIACIAIYMNANLNNITDLHIEIGNLIGTPAEHYDVLFFGDMLYDQGTAKELAVWARKICNDGKEIYIGDSQRLFMIENMRQHEVLRLAEYKYDYEIMKKEKGLDKSYVWKFICERPKS